MVQQNVKRSVSENLLDLNREHTISDQSFMSLPQLKRPRAARERDESLGSGTLGYGRPYSKSYLTTHRPVGEFGSGLCGCCYGSPAAGSQSNVCTDCCSVYGCRGVLEACICPCIMFGSTQHIFMNGTQNACVETLLCVICSPCCYAANQRGQSMLSAGYPSTTFCEAACVHTCCYPLALAQEARAAEEYSQRITLVNKAPPGSIAFER